MNSDKLIINLPDVEATLKLGSTLASFFMETQKLVPIIPERRSWSWKNNICPGVGRIFPRCAKRRSKQS